ncbi:MAG TPA: hypothetical protein VIF62_00305, partial [Labilithrix sp.]
DAKSNGSHPPRAIGAATTKWEPPAEFQARLSDAMSSERTSGVIVTPTPAPSSPRTPGVDTTIDDYSSPQSAPSLPGSVPRTMPGDPDSHPFTHYTPPAPTPSSRPPMSSEPRFSSHPPMPAAQPARSSRTIIFVALCFILGASLAAAVAWRMGRLGAGDDEERFVTRATDAMFKNQFVDPPGENVRDITNEGLRRWPNDKKLVDVRVRAASELVVRAQGQRGAGDISKALELARSAHDLDPNDATAKHLVEQYEAELAQFTAANTPPLDKPASLPKTLPPNVAAAQPYKVLLDLSAPAPRIGQTVDLTARVAPPKGAFDQPAFTITGPSGPVTMPAQSPAPGVYKGTYAFLEGGRFEVAFTTQADGKPLRASRVVVAGAPPPPTQPPQQQPTLPPATQQKEPPPVPPTSPSVKWM